MVVAVLLLDIKDVKVGSVLVVRFGAEWTILYFVDVDSLHVDNLVGIQKLMDRSFGFGGFDPGHLNEL